MPLAAEGLVVILKPIAGLSQPFPKGELRFMCPPLEEFAVEYAHSHLDYDTLKNQHSRPGVPQLATITFDTLVVDTAIGPRDRIHPLFVTDPNPQHHEDTTTQLQSILAAGKPFLFSAFHPAGRFIHPASLAHIGPEVSFPATLRSLRVAERAGEGDTRYLNVAFHEYRSPVAERIGAKNSKGKTAKTVILYWDGRAKDSAGKSLASPPATTLTLARLAKLFYGEPKLAREIAKANKIKGWGMNDALIKHPRYKKLKRGQSAKIVVPPVPMMNNIVGTTAVL